MKKILDLLFLLIIVSFAFILWMDFFKERKMAILDLSQETFRQTLVDKEKGQYLGHPATVMLPDGKTILAVYPKGHGGGELVFKRSKDGGRTWSERLLTPKSWKTSKEAPTLYRMQDAAGKERLMLFSGHYPIRQSTSEDNGATWSELKAIGDFGGILAMGSIERLHDGTYLGLFHDDTSLELEQMQTKKARYLELANEKEDFQNLINTKLVPIIEREMETLRAKIGTFKILKLVSNDGGVTWSNPEVIIERKDIDLAEPNMIRSPRGDEIATLFRENSRKKNSHVMFSRDEGMSWTEPRELPWTLTGDRHVAKYIPDGRLVVVFRDMAKNSQTRGDLVAWVGTYKDIVNGREGQYRVRLMDNKGEPKDGGYAGLEVLPDGTLVATSYGRWEDDQDPYIVSIRFTLGELDEKAP